VTLAAEEGGKRRPGKRTKKKGRCETQREKASRNRSRERSRAEGRAIACMVEKRRDKGSTMQKQSAHKELARLARKKKGEERGGKEPKTNRTRKEEEGKEKTKLFFSSGRTTKRTSLR